MEGYRIVAKLGKGSYGSIFVVRSLTDGKDYVMKRIPLLELDKRERDQVKLEVRLMQNMGHPNVVHYIDSFLFNDEDLCIIMSYCRRGDLRSCMKSPMPPTDVVRTFAQVCLAVHYLHYHNILHRDIKLGNLFMLGGGHVMLGDFGIARIMTSASEVAQAAVGTPLYMAPEVIHGGQYSCKSDVWAMGCILYELVMQKHPFEAKDLNKLMLKIVRGKYPHTRQRCSVAVSKLIAQMLHRDPEKRPTVEAILKLRWMVPHVVEYVQNSITNDVLFNQVESLGIEVRRPVEVKRPIIPHSHTSDELPFVTTSVMLPELVESVTARDRVLMARARRLMETEASHLAALQEAHVYNISNRAAAKRQRKQEALAPITHSTPLPELPVSDGVARCHQLELQIAKFHHDIRQKQQRLEELRRSIP